MIPVSWPDIVAGALAAATISGRTLTDAEASLVGIVARGVASVLASSIESPGQAAPSFSSISLGELVLNAATGKTTTLAASESQAADLTLTLPGVDGAAGVGVSEQVLQTNGAGVLAFADKTDWPMSFMFGAM